MTHLRAAREAKGLSLDDVAAEARIPRRYLAAIEDGDHTVLPPGPFLRGYRRQYLEFLGLEAEDALEDEPTDEVVRPRPAPRRDGPPWRLIAAGLVSVGLLVGGLRTASALLDRAEPAARAAAERAALDPEHVELRASERVAVRVLADGRSAFQGTLEAGTRREFSGLHRIAVDVGDLTRLTVSWNGERIEPLGNLSGRRRLVFVQGD